MASSWQYQHCYVGINSRVASFPLVLALVLGLTAIVTTGTANAQTYTVIHNFMGGADGAEPAYGLTIDSAGTLYGSTFSGDAGTGTIYTLTNQGSSGWSLNTLYMFSGGSDGAVPYAGVIFGPDGSLYGTTAFGGVGSCQTGGGKTGCGTAFNLTSSSQWRGKPSNGWTETVLYDFTGGGDGATPYGGRPIFDGAGNLYGTAFGGGLTNCPGGCGLVYELVPSNGGWTEKILYSFTGKPDGASPWAGVIFDQSGNLYGTTEFGGAYGYGTVFELIPSGSGWTEKVLYSFQNQPDGGQPYAGLIFDSSGIFTAQPLAAEREAAVRFSSYLLQGQGGAFKRFTPLLGAKASSLVVPLPAWFSTTGATSTARQRATALIISARCSSWHCHPMALGRTPPCMTLKAATTGAFLVATWCSTSTATSTARHLVARACQRAMVLPAVSSLKSRFRRNMLPLAPAVLWTRGVLTIRFKVEPFRTLPFRAVRVPATISPQRQPPMR